MISAIILSLTTLMLVVGITVFCVKDSGILTNKDFETGLKRVTSSDPNIMQNAKLFISNDMDSIDEGAIQKGAFLENNRNSELEAQLTDSDFRTTRVAKSSLGSIQNLTLRFGQLMRFRTGRSKAQSMKEVDNWAKLPALGKAKRAMGSAASSQTRSYLNSKAMSSGLPNDDDNSAQKFEEVKVGG